MEHARPASDWFGGDPMSQQFVVVVDGIDLTPEQAEEVERSMQEALVVAVGALSIEADVSPLQMGPEEGVVQELAVDFGSPLLGPMTRGMVFRPKDSPDGRGR